MFTLDQIKAAHSKVKSGADFPRYIQELKQLGVKSYSTYVIDGHTGYSGENNLRISSEARYNEKSIAEKANPEEFIHRLKLHQQGGTDYATFCDDSAAMGVEKWTVDLEEMTCTYYGRNGEKMLVEKIPGLAEY